MTYIIAEIGFNHEGSLDNAREMIRLAAEAGADAVKFQTFKASDIALPSSEHFNAIKAGEVGMGMMVELKKACDWHGVDFLSTPFSLEAVDMLEELGVAAYKIASMDCTNPLLLRHVASKGKPVYLSTGMASLDEIRAAVALLRKHGAAEVVALHCISKYPAHAGDLQLGVIPALAEALGCPVGYSDHYPGNPACVAAFLQGATVIETHFTDDPSRPGGDHGHSCGPRSLAELVDLVRNWETFNQGGAESLTGRSDREFAKLFRRGAYAVRPLAAGTAVRASDVVFCRPAHAMGPAEADRIVGKRLVRDLEACAPFRAEDLEG